MKVGILTASPPGEFGVGQNYLRSLVRSLTGNQVFVAALLRDPIDWRIGDRSLCDDFVIYDQKYESPKRFGRGLLADWSAYTALRGVALPHARQTAVRLANDLQKHAVDRLLVVLESPQLMMVSEAVLRLISIPITSLVWDHPEHVIGLFGHNGQCRRRLLKAFDKVISNSAGLLTVAEPLRESLAASNGSAVSRVYRCPIDAARLSTEMVAEQTGPFRIGFAGSVTAPDELECLQSALDELGWEIAGRPIELNLFGKRFRMVSHRPRNIRYHGFLETQDQVIEQLAGCHLCYLPQPFARDRHWFTEYSFPTKASTYMASGTPILLHAPQEAVLSRFSKLPAADDAHSRFGFQCGTQHPRDLARIIEKIVTDECFYHTGVERARKTALTAFTEPDGSRAVHDVLGLDIEPELHFDATGMKSETTREYSP